ncbi:MAG: 2-oxoglutarate dehydrogenase E1 component [Candidatus Marinimicrobia bacterium]|nr:2-oxoglutarate dehydrogenase E1 component [Candidatus Neomarinimicrobiota bacterium]MCF7828500.1 2-oxoglutarate dehydrogenase E1 component [Candidatus Neomarinimicrobiota bacterium]MCF7881990.1 2-oxoglutarate dehydrogenase E1 component [Candidatus Neomarinimicrobiota bacterium]
MEDFSFLHNAHPDYIEGLYDDYREDPDSVREEWRDFFAGYEFAQQSGETQLDIPEAAEKERLVLNLISGYRRRGHLFTKTNPVRERRKYSPTLDIENFGLTEEDLDTTFQAGHEIGIGPATLREIIDHLKTTYCRSIGAEYRFIREPEKVQWLQDKMESSRNLPDFAPEEKRRILHKLNQAVVFENFLHTKYVGQKRFALSGGETLIPGLDAVLEKGAELGVEEVVLGMAHRGRLNVLANIMDKSYEEIFSEFEGAAYQDSVFEGDVKYHLGYTSDVTTQSGKEVRINLAPNPSHLESVDPVVEGMSRSKIDNLFNDDIDKVVPILIHGDAAIAGQGVVYEVIQMSLLDGYRTGGTIHLVINNQVGFTTNYLQGRSSTYCTDVAKVTLSPVFHVNADDAEAVVFAIQMAMEYRQKFNTDVFIDLLGYRKYGHNEADEPRFTQPKLYEIIEQHPDPREIYNNKLLEAGTVEKGIAEEMEEEFRQMLEEHLSEAKEDKQIGPPFTDDALSSCEDQRRPQEKSLTSSPETGVDESTLLSLGEKIFTVPEDMDLFRKIKRLYGSAKERLTEKKTLDWALAEQLAYASLLTENVPIRLTGQDAERGTFSHRHAVLLSRDAEERYVPLNNLSDDQAPFRIHNSPLNEYGVMGFEYGYACATPEGLTIWEAQFGDFYNGAQIIVDQYISASEAKWNRSNGLVLYLPHGYEGQGPEHSSARIERFLELSANNNWQVINPTTPANLFHMLRRHMAYPFRIPLVVYTPKSLLRHPKCISPLEDLTTGGFKEVIDDKFADPSEVKSLLLCSGKVYYDLLERQEEESRNDVAIIRMEQLYPLPEKQLTKIFDKYKNVERYIWVQEEPENMGAWAYLCRKFDLVELGLVARRNSASPATGFHKQHAKEQESIINRAFNTENEGVKAPGNGNGKVVAEKT